MSFSYLGFFISQMVFVPVFLIATRKLFKPNMRFRDYVGYTLISPFFVYLFSMGFYGIASVLLPNDEIFNRIASYADLFALALSFLFAYLYSRTCEGNARKMMFFVYISFYMVGMVFSLLYTGDIQVLVFSVLVPIATAIIMYTHFVRPLARVSLLSAEFHWAMLALPIASEAMLVLRFLLNIVNNEDRILWKYDTYLQVYSTLFGYIILILIFACTGMIAKDIRNIGIIRDQKENLELENARVRKLTFDMLRALVGTIEAKDKYTNGHSNRVAVYSKMIAGRLGYSEEAQERIYNAALLHDIGKIAVPDEIINCPTSLTNEQFKIIMRHPLKGADILKNIDEMPELSQGAMYHHERWDGAGYPHGLEGEAIPEVARIISVADAYDAMTSQRSYRPAMDKASVRAEIEKGIGTQFYPEAAGAMLNIIDEDVEYRLRQIGMK